MIWFASPTLIALAAFATFSLAGEFALVIAAHDHSFNFLCDFTGNELTASKAFTTLALFNILRFPIGNAHVLFRVLA